MTCTQHSRLLDSLFSRLDTAERITVLHIGPALPETIDFFSAYRCQLHFVDLFDELSVLTPEPNNDANGSVAEISDAGKQLLSRQLSFARNTCFDLCLFWDIFSYLRGAAIRTMVQALQPYLRETSLAHGFGIHNIHAAAVNQVYGIVSSDTISQRPRNRALPGYAPHSQRQLQTLLSGFTFERSVLLSDGRLELQLRHRR